MSDAGFRFGDWRMLNEFELAVLTRCQQLDSAVGSLVSQARATRARTVESEKGDYWRVEFESGQAVSDRHICEADIIADDVDRVPINALFFSCGGVPLEIEFIRMDGLPIRQMPPASAFDLTSVRYP